MFGIKEEIDIHDAPSELVVIMADVPSRISRIDVAVKKEKYVSSE